MKMRKTPRYFSSQPEERKWKLRLRQAGMAVVWPFKQKTTYVLVLLFAFFAPTFNGIKPAEVHLWYWQKLKNGAESLYSLVSHNAKNIMGKADLSFMKESPFADRGIDKLVETSDIRGQNIRRKAFGKAETVPAGVDIMKHDINANGVLVPVLEPEKQQRENAEAVKLAEEINPENVDAGEARQLAEKSDNDYRRDMPMLDYPEKPIPIKGQAFVYNANAIDVDGTYMFMFGIYSNPAEERGQLASQFLEKLIENREVDCDIVAYTKEQVPTVICYINGVNINKLLVIKGLSDNIAL